MADTDKIAQIISGCKAGKNESFCELVDLYAGRLYGYFYRLTGDRTISDDLISELFVKLVGNIKHYRGGRFDGWLFTVASSVFGDYLRLKLRQKKALAGKTEQLRITHPQNNIPISNSS